MKTQVQRVTCITVHGETDREAAQKVLDEKSARERLADNTLLPNDQWPQAECDVVAIFVSDNGSRLELKVRDWDVAASLVPGVQQQMTLADVPQAQTTAMSM